MKENREATVSYLAFYPSYYETITDFLPEEDQLAAMKALLDYGLYGEEPPDDIKQSIKIIFAMARPTIDKHRKDIENGKKGGRPKKEDKEDDSETGVKRGVKRAGNTKKEKEKEKEREREKDTSFPFPYKDDEDAFAPAPEGGARTSHSFTFTDVLNTIREHDIELTEEEAQDFYEWMEKYSWKIKGNKVTKLENAIKGYAKKHHQGSDTTKSAEPIERKEIRESRQIWNELKTSRPEYEEPPVIRDKVLDNLMREHRISEWDVQHFVGLILPKIMNEKYESFFDKVSVDTPLTDYTERQFLAVRANLRLLESFIDD